MQRTDGKENTEELGELEEEDVKGTYIWLSCTLAVVTSAVKGTVRWPVVDGLCKVKEKSIPFLSLCYL